MSEQQLTQAFQAYFDLNEEHEEALWARFSARRAGEVAAWGAFGAAMVLLNVRLQPARRAPMQLFQYMLGRRGR